MAPDALFIESISSVMSDHGTCYALQIRRDCMDNSDLKGMTKRELEIMVAQERRKHEIFVNRLSLAMSRFDYVFETQPEELKTTMEKALMQELWDIEVELVRFGLKKDPRNRD